jgi:hypothetical protein
LRYQDYEAAITSHWLQLGIGPREAAAKLQAACGDIELDEETIRKLEARWQQKHDALSVVYGILAGPWKRLAGFDCEDVVSPADHTDIVGYLGATTANKFVAENVIQSIEPNGDLRLSLTHEGDTYAFTFKDGGSWCNLSGLLVGLNRLLEQLHIPERFIELYAGDGPGVVVFVLPKKFLPAARELGIQLELRFGQASSGGQR